jgi:hypothetical protein
VLWLVINSLKESATAAGFRAHRALSVNLGFPANPAFPVFQASGALPAFPVIPASRVCLVCLVFPANLARFRAIRAFPEMPALVLARSHSRPWS